MGLLSLTESGWDDPKELLHKAESLMRADFEQQQRFAPHVCARSVDVYEQGVGSEPGIVFDAYMRQAAEINPSEI